MQGTSSLTTCYVFPSTLGNPSCVSLVLVCFLYWTPSSMRRVETIPVLFTTAAPVPFWSLAWSRCSIPLCVWMNRIFWSPNSPWTHINTGLYLALPLWSHTTLQWLNLTQLCWLFSGIWRIRIRRWPTSSTTSSWKRRRMPSFWRKCAGGKIAWLTPPSTCRWAQASPLLAWIVGGRLALTCSHYCGKTCAEAVGVPLLWIQH